jgi:hypothetical protein
VTDDIANAEALLREIAHELVTLPLDEHARHLHLRVLSYKRLVTTWGSEPPDLAVLETTLTALRALHEEVSAVRSTSEVRLRPAVRASYRPASYAPPPAKVRTS